MNKPIISVIMPIYNTERYLKESIDSVLNQTYTNFEFIILNDASTDETENIILSYNDNRIVYIKNDTNLRISKTLNKGIDIAKGKYIARMDSDDICLPHRFKAQIDFMQKNPDIDLCGSWLKFFGHHFGVIKFPLKHDEIKVSLLFTPGFGHPTVLGKTSFFKELKYDDDYVLAEDYELWIRGVDKYRYENIPEILLKYRVHNKQSNGSEQIKQAGRCTIKILDNLGCDLSKDELDVFNNLSLHKAINYKNFIMLHNKILETNKKFNYFKQKILEKILIEKVFYTVEKYNLKLLFSGFKPLKHLTCKNYIKYIIKCLIGYKAQ